jgi:AraC-like DNA-binding protein
LTLHTWEIVYRLLIGEQSARLRYDFDQPLRIEQLARDPDMGVLGLYRYFKAVMAMIPLQYQKRLRLLEARRLLLGEALDATRAVFRVGYQDVSHFNREYKSLFGVPPMCNVHRLRKAVEARSDR